MLGFLWRWVVGRFGCEHKWNTVKEIRLVDGGANVGTKFILHCEKCGDLKKRVL